jgi:hypothetical protein
MLKEAASGLHRARPALTAWSLLSLSVVMALSGAPAATAQTTKAAVASTSLGVTGFPQWAQELGYEKAQIYPLTLAPTGCPLVDVDISGVTVTVILDSGTASGFSITNHAPPIPHHVEGREEALNADGSHRGETLRIRVETMSVLGEVFKNVRGDMSDWQMDSSVPFDGSVGLDLFLKRRLTLDCRSKKVGTTSLPLPDKLDAKRYLSLDLVDPPPNLSQGHILYVRGRVNGRDAIIYLDTGTNVSFIDPAFAEGLTRVERPGKFKVFREQVPIKLGGHTLILDDLRESEVRRGSGFDLPVALLLGSDVLSRFIITIDLRAKKLILAAAK